MNPSTYVSHVHHKSMMLPCRSSKTPPAKAPVSIGFTTKLLMCALQWMPIPGVKVNGYHMIYVYIYVYIYKYVHICIYI